MISRDLELLNAVQDGVQLREERRVRVKGRQDREGAGRTMWRMRFAARRCRRCSLVVRCSCAGAGRPNPRRPRAPLPALATCVAVLVLALAIPGAEHSTSAL